MGWIFNKIYKIVTWLLDFQTGRFILSRKRRIFNEVVKCLTKKYWFFIKYGVVKMSFKRLLLNQTKKQNFNKEV